LYQSPESNRPGLLILLDSFRIRCRLEARFLFIKNRRRKCIQQLRPATCEFRMFGGNTMAAKILTILLGLPLVLAVACGGAPAAPEPTATQVADTAQAAEPTAAPVVGETAQPTATPQAVAPPAEVEVNPGKLTIMIGDLGNERFDRALGSGVGNNFGRIVHGFLISTNERKKMVPGIASQWGLSPDGLTWTFTIRKGVKWHDGSELTPQDVLWTLQHYFGPQAVEYTNQSNAAVLSRAMDRIELRGPDEVSLTTQTPITQLDILVGEAASNWF